MLCCAYKPQDVLSRGKWTRDDVKHYCYTHDDLGSDYKEEIDMLYKLKVDGSILKSFKDASSFLVIFPRMGDMYAAFTTKLFTSFQGV